MTIPAITTINDGDAVEVAPVNANYSNIRTSLNGNLDNTNWSSTSSGRLAGSKVNLSSNPEFLTEHDSTTFLHTTTSSGFRALRIKVNVDSASNQIDQIDLDATDVSMRARSGASFFLAQSTTTGDLGVDLTASLAANGPLGIDNGADDGREINTIYYIWLVADSSGTDTPDLTCVFSKEAAASSTFWTNIDDHVMTGGAADYALLLGAVYNDANNRIKEQPRTVSGGSNGIVFMPVYTLSAHGSYTGNGVNDRKIDVGFEPDIVILTASERFGIYRTGSHIGDLSSFLTAVVPDRANMIQEFGWDGTDNWGFEIGDDIQVNESGLTYYWSAWRNHNIGTPTA